ncbi:uncharacterized protein F5Z01DRAFT_622184 [Emericellopsis atlantica]|uniref:Secreted protein n=1 Tax=Emericellopsis atlantica TaxID=2614577 RepID=A0A9P7ZM20_9HYPO|nr:uncharacterized protein F5Z01DRAFT_622184 [Emericellopsis atlantica]KAG9254500.1 hypothetical protein F5Z01DRAFT_622184 [Emericellopsis atlantica]
MLLPKTLALAALVSQVLAQPAPFPLSSLKLLPSRWMSNQDRTLSYLLDVDVDRLLYNFRANHGLDTQDVTVNGGWDAPDFPFRTHVQGHFLTAWSHCWAVLSNEECKSRAEYFVQELAKCQANNEEAGFGTGYLSGFPESEFAKVEDRTLDNGNVPYYSIHKTMAGLLDVYRQLQDETALEVLVRMGDWVDARSAALSEAQMQEMLQTEYGGINDIFAQMYLETGTAKWLDVAQRFDHHRIFNPLAEGRDELAGLHANTQAQKLIGVWHEYEATNDTYYLDVARNAWSLVVHAHSYAVGGNSQAEHFRDPDAISTYLDEDTCETCNTYNMLKLTRALFTHDPDGTTTYFDFYERALLNHLLGVQHPQSEHGHITYFTPLNPGGRRGVGPAWGGGTYSTDYDSFWCCQGTSLETNTKFMDSIYWQDEDVLYVNLFISSEVQWDKVTVRQETNFPVEDTTTLTVDGDGDFEVRLRIPSWTAGDASLTVNGEVSDVVLDAGRYASVQRTWSSGDKVELTLPMDLHTIPANDDPNVAALAYGPTVLSGKYGDRSLDALPVLDVNSVEKVSEGLVFEGKADGETVELGGFYDAHDVNYNVYWRLSE